MTAQKVSYDGVAQEVISPAPDTDDESTILIVDLENYGRTKVAIWPFDQFTPEVGRKIHCYAGQWQKRDGEDVLFACVRYA